MKSIALWAVAVMGPALLELLLLIARFDGAAFLTAYITSVIVVGTLLYWYSRRGGVVRRPALLTATFAVCAIITLCASFLLLLAIMRGHN